MSQLDAEQQGLIAVALTVEGYTPSLSNGWGSIGVKNLDTGASETLAADSVGFESSRLVVANLSPGRYQFTTLYGAPPAHQYSAKLKDLGVFVVSAKKMSNLGTVMYSGVLNRYAIAADRDSAHLEPLIEKKYPKLKHYPRISGWQKQPRYKKKGLLDEAKQADDGLRNPEVDQGELVGGSRAGLVAVRGKLGKWRLYDTGSYFTVTAVERTTADTVVAATEGNELFILSLTTGRASRVENNLPAGRVIGLEKAGHKLVAVVEGAGGKLTVLEASQSNMKSWVAKEMVASSDSTWNGILLKGVYANQQYVYVASGDKVLIRSNATGKWQLSTKEFKLSNASAFGANHFVAVDWGMTSADLHFTSDGGKSWQVKNTERMSFPPQFLNQTEGYFIAMDVGLSAVDFEVKKTTNGGRGWELQGEIGNKQRCELRIINAQELVCTSASYNQAWVSNDQGKTWRQER